MTHAALCLALAVLALAPSAAVLPAHYGPRVGDSLTFYEVISVVNGTGSDYTGYSDVTYVNGSLAITATLPNGTDTATYRYLVHYLNSSGGDYSYTSQGTFTFSNATFRYVTGTDNQTGYTNPFVWFFVNDSLPLGGTLHLLNTPMSVVRLNDSIRVGSLTSTGYAATTATSGRGAYVRNDGYGVFTAAYTWMSFFDPSTGYTVGYSYLENDTNSSGDGFQYLDELVVTGTSFPLTAASPPPAASSGPSGLPLLDLVVAGVVVLVIVLLLVAFLVARRRRVPRLPRHSPGGSVPFGSMPPAPPTGPAPPPIGLIPSGQPGVQQIVIKETVKVNCRYCGALIDTTAAVCPNCGAPRS